MYLNPLEEQLAIINSYSFRRMQGKTQVIFNDNKKNIHVRNRLTHSLEVATIAKKISLNVNLKYPKLNIDPDIVFNVGLCHDLGHPPMGHVGQRILSKKFSKLGLYFDDNANTLNVIEKDLNDISDITKLSLIKYPYIIKDKKTKGIYKSQYKKYYSKLLELSEKQNINLNVKRIRTYESEIMELADDIAYLTSDIEDAVGYYNVKITKKYLEELKTKFHYFDEDFFELLINIDKDNIQKIAHKIKNEFIANIYFNLEQNCFVEIKEDILKKKILRQICKDLYIDKYSVLDDDKLMKKYGKYIDFLIENVDDDEIMKKHMISRTYLNKLLNSYKTEKKLRYLLLSIAELTDQWVLKKIKYKI